MLVLAGAVLLCCAARVALRKLGVLCVGASCVYVGNSFIWENVFSTSSPLRFFFPCWRIQQHHFSHSFRDASAFRFSLPRCLTMTRFHILGSGCAGGIWVGCCCSGCIVRGRAWYWTRGDTSTRVRWSSCGRESWFQVRAIRLVGRQ